MGGGRGGPGAGIVARGRLAGRLPSNVLRAEHSFRVCIVVQRIRAHNVFYYLRLFWPVGLCLILASITTVEEIGRLASSVPTLLFLFIYYFMLIVFVAFGLPLADIETNVVS